MLIDALNGPIISGRHGTGRRRLPDPMLLRDHVVHVWSVSLDDISWLVEFLSRFLSADEVERAMNFRSSLDRRRFIICRAALRIILAGYHITATPSAIRFRYGEYGKPAISAPETLVPLRFNVSHAGGMALIAVTRRFELGIDVEPVRSIEDIEGIVEEVLSSPERRQFDLLTRSQQVTAFLTAWTRKEAYGKARGMGLAFPLRDLSVSLDPNAHTQFLGGDDGSRVVSLQSVQVDAHYIAALAVEGAGYPTVMRSWVSLKAFRLREPRALV
jgi:4'-phosphopantetheinyl transferase